MTEPPKPTDGLLIPLPWIERYTDYVEAGDTVPLWWAKALLAQVEVRDGRIEEFEYKVLLLKGKK